MLKKDYAHSFTGSGARCMRHIILAAALLLCCAPLAFASTNLDVIDYDALLEPDLSAQTIRGEVTVTFKSLVNDLKEVVLDAQELQVKEVREGPAALRFESKEGRLIIHLERAARAGVLRTLKILYEGKPTRGLRFYEDHLYAAYNTPRWMVCNFEPGDKATLTLRLTLPENFKMVANGEQIESRSLAAGRAQRVWREEASVPPYVYGFAAGRFQEVTVKKNKTELFYLARSLYTPAEVERIFADTPDMLSFFESRSGVPYPKRRYTQVLASGNTMQEMSAFTVLRENYGREVLGEPRENWLIAHELAHQWWGVRVSCAGWADFWLNEGFAEFMMSAYRERRNGREEYDRDMEMARSSNARLRVAGRDRPLAYRETITESRAGGLIVYDKGALVLALLRYELGEKAFWRAVRLYTSRNFGRSVVTGDLLKAMEETSGKSLKGFFEQWVYGAGVPEIIARHRVEGDLVIVELEQRQDALWNLSFQVTVETERGRESLRVNLKDKRQELRFRLKGNLLSVRVDDGGHLPFRLRQEGRSLSMLLHQLAHEPDTAGRAEALDQIQALLSSTKEESARADLRAALEERAARDPARLIRALAKKALEK